MIIFCDVLADTTYNHTYFLRRKKAIRRKDVPMKHQKKNSGRRKWKNIIRLPAPETPIINNITKTAVDRINTDKMIMERRGKSLNDMRIQNDRIRDKILSMVIERSNGRYPEFGTPVYNWAEEKKERLLDISNRYVHNLANSLGGIHKVATSDKLYNKKVPRSVYMGIKGLI